MADDVWSDELIGQAGECRSGADDVGKHEPVRAASQGGAFDVVVMAASLGGREVLSEVLRSLDESFPVPIVAVLHGAVSFALLGRRLGIACALPIHGARMRDGTLYLAPAGRHLEIGTGNTARLTDGPRVQFARPAADTLFRSAAAASGPRVLGVVLSGRLSDGAAGAAVIRAAGGVVLVQSPETCRAPGMPRAAIRGGGATLVLPPRALGPALVALVTVPGVPAIFGITPRGRAA